MSVPLLQLQALRREYPAGEQTLVVLEDIDLSIDAGEFVAIVGASGSGKSTLMNILGCLDRPTRGSYRVAGRETGALDADQLAELRREHFGFVFQRYHLLSDLSALSNVETPAVYAGTPAALRHERATRLLTRLGLADRLEHRPGQLSGGQQQRVSIARALMNGGEVILADEPTGALDSASGAEMLALLGELHADGHTIILVTHDMQVAEHAQRVIEISDGSIVADRRRGEGVPSRTLTPTAVSSAGWLAVWGRFREAFRMAVLAMTAHRLRTFLTMLGIIIGIASVVSVVALGEGSRQRILSDISAIGTNIIDIYPGNGFGDMWSGRVRTLVPADADVLAQQDYVDSVTPGVSQSVTLRYGNVSVNASVNGVGEQYFRVRGFEIAQGVAFDAGAVRRLSQDVVVDDNTYRKLFPAGGEAIGAVILLGNLPCRIIGVTKKKDSAFSSSDSLNVFVPYTTAMSRLLGRSYLRNITVRVDDTVSMEAAEQGITNLLRQRHGSQDFYVSNIDSVRQTIEQTTQTMTLLVSSIAVISLIVGGIGVMNIMLVSVTERTREIGVRMAVGARQGDILQQFLIEAILVCLFGGLLGVLAALAIGVVFARVGGGNFTMVYSITSMIVAFACSTLIGVVFGFLPARNAARLDPVEALARE